MDGIKFTDLVLSIKNRPKMYLEENRLDYIFYFLYGNLGAGGYSQYVDKNVSELFFKEYFKWLSLWISDKYDNGVNVKTSPYWYRMIYEISKSEEEALMIFYESFDEFVYKFRKTN